MKKYYWMYKQAVCNSILKIISITSLLSVCIWISHTFVRLLPFFPLFARFFGD
jgi:hypothetical protein